MKVLGPRKPTSEQLTVINDHKLGTTLIRGAAGSGKTTTALLRLKQESRFWNRRRRDGHIDGPPRILVLTYNRTLRGYIEALVQDQVEGDVQVEVSTFAKWAWQATGRPQLAQLEDIENVIANFGLPLQLSRAFLLEEVDYVLGRLPLANLSDYATPGFRRIGRGASPRVEIPMRQRILAEVIVPFSRWKASQKLLDHNDVANLHASKQMANPYHVVIVDEAQDFSANQVRAIQVQLAPEYSETFILDAAQQIYPRRFTWREAGVSIATSFRLERNFRNTAEIAAFAMPLVANMDHGDDGTIPDFTRCDKTGARPKVVSGKFRAQAAWVVADIVSRGSACTDSVGILHSKGGHWFDEIRRQLTAASIEHVTISQKEDWPRGPVSVALSTMHSAKGLEFDHVYIVGLNAEVTPHGAEAGDSLLETYQRLLAMAIGRAAKTVMISYKEGEASVLTTLLDPSTYDRINV